MTLPEGHHERFDEATEHHDHLRGPHDPFTLNTIRFHTADTKTSIVGGICTPGASFYIDPDDALQDKSRDRRERKAK